MALLLWPSFVRRLLALVRHRVPAARPSPAGAAGAVRRRRQRRSLVRLWRGILAAWPRVCSRLPGLTIGRAIATFAASYIAGLLFLPAPGGHRRAGKRVPADAAPAPSARPARPALAVASRVLLTLTEFGAAAPFLLSPGSACVLSPETDATRRPRRSSRAAPRSWPGCAFLLPVIVLCWPIAAGYFLGGAHSDQYVAGYAFREFGAEYFRTYGSIPAVEPVPVRRDAVHRRSTATSSIRPPGCAGSCRRARRWPRLRGAPRSWPARLLLRVAARAPDAGGAGRWSAGSPTS